MKMSIGRVLFYGLLLWVIPFVVSILVFSTKNWFPPFFETIMAVTVTLSGVFFALLYFGRVEGDHVRRGVVVGGIWFAMSILIDLPLFLFGGPMQMHFTEYLMDIGLTYLIYPTITLGFGYLLHRRA